LLWAFELVLCVEDDVLDEREPVIVASLLLN
jgi:hypothetical protein